MMQGWYYVESLTGQRHDRVQTESQIATVDSCFDLVGSLQHGVASCEVFSWSTDIHKPTVCKWWWPQMKLKSKSLPMSHANRMTKNNKKSLEYRFVASTRKMWTDTNCPEGKSWPNHIKNEQHCPMSRALHVTLANWQRFGFKLAFKILLRNFDKFDPN